MRHAWAVALIAVLGAAQADRLAWAGAGSGAPPWTGSTPYRACVTAAQGIDGKMAGCAHAEFEREDKLLALEYAARLGRAAGKLKDAVVASQRAWLAYRDPTCEAEREVYAGGPLQPYAFDTCEARLTHERVTWLLTLDP